MTSFPELQALVSMRSMREVGMGHGYSAATWRVYAAEQTLPGGPAITRIDDIRRQVSRFRRSEWWRNHFDDVGPISSQRFASETSAADATSLGLSTRDGHRLRFTRPVNEFVVLHELAHVIAPKFRPCSRRPVADRHFEPARHESHGEHFAAALVELANEFGVNVKRDELADAYQHYEVPVAEFADLVQARWECEHTGQILAENRRDTAEMFAAYEAEHRQRFPDRTPEREMVIPAFTWGDWFRQLYQNNTNPSTGRRWSRTALADALRPVERCTIADIKAIEKAQQRPDDPRLRRIAMGIVVLVGIDPIWARLRMGLVRWACHIDFDELRLLNADWVANVEHLNDLMESRPPLWAIHADR